MVERNDFELVDDGDQLNEGYFNGMYYFAESWRVYREILSDATERTTTSTSMADTATTFNISAPVGSLITGFWIKAGIKTTAGDGVHFEMKISGTNLGALYATAFKNNRIHEVPRDDWVYGIFDVSNDYGLGGTIDTSYVTNKYFVPCSIKVVDAVTTLTMRLRRTGGTGYINNVEIEVIYVEKFEEV
jgi:hypothetical protein